MSDHPYAQGDARMSTWWQRGVIYQIYPRSFQDRTATASAICKGSSSGSIISCWLGIDAIWISPIYPSPMADFGYDVADYCAVDPLFGTLEDFDRLLAAAHARGLKVHPGLRAQPQLGPAPMVPREPRLARQSETRLVSLARSRAGRRAAEQLDQRLRRLGLGLGRGHRAVLLSRLSEGAAGPQLAQSELRQAMYDVLRFWLDRGVDGFRIDVLWHMIKAADFRDNPINPSYRPSMGEMHRVLQHNSTDQPEVHEIAARDAAAHGRVWRALVDRRDLPAGRAVDGLLRRHAGRGAPSVQLSAHRRGLECARSRLADRASMRGPCRPAAGRIGFSATMTGRASPLGSAQKQARVAAMLLLTLRGTPTMYYGDELGLDDVGDSTRSRT